MSAGTEPSSGLTKKILRLTGRDPFALAGISIYVVFALTALLANVIAPHDPMEILFLPDGNVAMNQRPSPSYWLGTTSLGRDVFSQLVFGARSALMVGLSAALVVVVVGTLVGLFSGYFGGWVDNVLMRIGDIALSIPFLPFIIVLAAFVKPNVWNVVIGVSALLWPNTGRIVRSQVLSLRERSYVEAAKVSGASHLNILFTHIAPNVLPISFLYGSIVVGWAIFTEASISFLGFGPSDTVSWGFMLQDAFVSQALSRGAYYWFIPSGVCIMLMVSAGFFISRGYEELLFPKLRD
ncbi:MAG: ABC transporter permease [Betaproteobacteria bacterium]|nr:ABC transporter permease [Betaproteobacteria bacterium]